MSRGSGIQPVRLEMNVNGNPFIAFPVLLWDEKEAVLVDAGLPGQLQAVERALAGGPVSMDQLTKVVVTHQDMDHIGGLPEMYAASGGRLEVLCHELIRPYVEGEEPLVKRQVKVPPTPVSRTFRDGEVLPFAGGLRVVFTPGHTPDHASLYHEPSKTLIAGDALTSDGGVLLPPNPQFTPDYPAALASVGRLLELDIAAVITYHGGLVTEGIRDRLAAIAAGR